MATTREQKVQTVSEINVVAQSALSAVTADYTGLSVAQMNALRVNARQKGVYLRVVRNSLARLAFNGTDFECLSEGLSGPILLAMCKDEPGAAARLIRDFVKESREHEKLEVQALAVSGIVLPASDLGRIAKLPTYDEAIATLMSVMNAPVTQLVRTINEPTAQMVRAVDAVAKKKQES